MKKLLYIVLILAVVLVGLCFAKNIIAKIAIEKGVHVATGLQLKMQKFNLSLFKTSVGIKGLQLFNPKEYPDKVMIDLPEIYVNYSLSELFKRKIHVEEIRIHLKEFVVVKNEAGELNLDSLRMVKDQEEKKAPKEEKPKKKGKAPEMQIDILELQIGRVVYKDYSKGPEPSVREYNLNMNERYTNITNPAQLASLIIVRALMGTNIAKLANFDVSGLKGQVTDALASSKALAVETAAKAQEAITEHAEKARHMLEESETLQESAKAVKGTAKRMTEGLKSKTKELKEKFKLSF